MKYSARTSSSQGWSNQIPASTDYEPQPASHVAMPFAWLLSPATSFQPAIIAISIRQHWSESLRQKAAWPREGWKMVAGQRNGPRTLPAFKMPTIIGYQDEPLRKIAIVPKACTS